VTDIRYLVLSDIHGNIDALDAALAAADGAWDRVLVLGDLVGYGAEPNAVVERVLALEPVAVIRGNHDKAACGIDSGEGFNHVARFAATWTDEHLTPAHREYLRALPAGPVAIDERLEICHGAPFDEDHYIFDLLDAGRALAAASRPVCLFGHTHLPVVFAAAGSEPIADVPDDDGAELHVGEGRYLVNPGSIGQPRDGDTRAAFGIYRTDGLFTFRRVEYDVAAAQRRIAAAGLPHSLAHRLSIGR
jgi:diadenosine tetraphosphatase ApaH/serine/threonine PP2A family protein phosphatase